MKICYLGNATSIHTQKWAESFASLGHEVTLLTFDYQEIEGVNCHRIITKYPGKYQQFFLEIKQVKNKLAQLSPDIVHAHWLPTYGLLAALTSYHPLVVSAWGGDIQRAPFQGTKKWFYRLVDKYVISKADIITTESQVLKNILLEKFNTPIDKIATFPWGVDTKVYSRRNATEIKHIKSKLGIDEDSHVVIYNREIRFEYNTEILLKAIPEILAQIPDTMIIFLGGYGDPEYIKKMQFLADELKVSHAIKIIPEVLSQEGVGQLLNVSDVFVSIPKQDSISCAVLEGMLCGVIPVVSDIPANRQLISNGENGYLVSGNCPHELAETIGVALKNKRILKNTMGQANRTWVTDNASWDFSLKTMLHIYNNLVLKNLAFKSKKS